VPTSIVNHDERLFAFSADGGHRASLARRASAFHEKPGCGGSEPGFLSAGPRRLRPSPTGLRASRLKCQPLNTQGVPIRIRKKPRAELTICRVFVRILVSVTVSPRHVAGMRRLRPALFLLYRRTMTSWPLHCQVREIIVTLPGTTYTVTYYKRDRSPQLLARLISDADDKRAPLKLSESLSGAWKAANSKARELGWIG
jgi:hypothetical protein